MVAWLALILLPSRPRVVVAAAWFVALLPAVPHYSAFVYNDRQRRYCAPDQRVRQPGAHVGHEIRPARLRPRLALRCRLGPGGVDRLAGAVLLVWHHVAVGLEH